ncbi:hypothetical protein CTI12_AA056120 [Artemisia annua]|uniref:Uncharacterized protein n=1 Tax=Artemisia annua TaxID=35608 RepID=A0A2U1Q9U1_ARTAN|nr:hypothetical protein CTI12_AA056120 [Artemisia annua]
MAVGSYEAERMRMIEELEAIIARKKRILYKLLKTMALLRKQVAFYEKKLAERNRILALIRSDKTVNVIEKDIN